jgi:hypothetical protein
MLKRRALPTLVRSRKQSLGGGQLWNAPLYFRSLAVVVLSYK